MSKKQSVYAKAPKIEKGIPIPSKQEQSPLTATMRGMSVGDSFQVDIPAGGMGNYHTYAKFAGIRITTRTLPGKQQARVWRSA